MKYNFNIHTHVNVCDNKSMSLHFAKICLLVKIQICSEHEPMERHRVEFKLLNSDVIHGPQI